MLYTWVEPFFAKNLFPFLREVSCVKLVESRSRGQGQFFFAFLGFIHAHIFTVYGSMHDFFLEKNIGHVCKDDISTK